MRRVSGALVVLLGVALLLIGLQAPSAEADELGPIQVTAPHRSYVETPLTVSGTLPVEGQTSVWLELQEAEQWTNKHTVTSSPDGQFTSPVPFTPDIAGTTVWRFGATIDDQTIHSDPFPVERLSTIDYTIKPFAFVGEASSVVGTVRGFTTGANVWTEVEIAPGTWSRSQTRTVRQGGSFEIPLTYGKDSPGLQTWRVLTDSGGIVTFAHGQVSQTRVGPVISTGPTWAYYSEAPEATGTIDHAINGVPVWTEFLVNGRWSKSQSSTLEYSRFRIPLTYGRHSLQPVEWRVGTTIGGTTAYSAPRTLRRANPLTVGAAPIKNVGDPAFAWGQTTNLPAGTTVWTEVNINGRWSKSQVGVADADRHYVLPLTYGANNVGSTTWRVAAKYDETTTLYSSTFTVRRISPVTVTASSAGKKVVGQTTNTWGKVTGVPRGTRVWTEVVVNTEFSKSQVRTTSASGAFTIPLTYGSNTPGLYTWRVGTEYDGVTAYSIPFTLTRTGR